MQNRNSLPQPEQNTPHTPDTADNARAEKRKRRRMMRILLSCLLVAAVLIAALEIVLRVTEDPSQTDPRDLSYATDDRNLSFYEPEPDVDIFTDSAWLEEDRHLYYSDGAEGMILTEEHNEAGTVGKLFLRYFSALTHGSAEDYAVLFTEKYRESGQLPEYFTMQRVYDIKVTKTLEAQITEGDYAGQTRYLFTVTYCIMRNDGTFRRDISGSSVVPQVFELLSDGTNVYINGIETIRRAS